MTGPRRVVLLRHGETTHNAAGIWQGHLDTELSELGREQAAAAGHAVAALGPTHIVSSDLLRARATAEAVGRATGLPVDLDHRFREIDVGEWQGLGNEEVSRRWPEERAAVLRGEDVPRGVSGESMADVRTRVGAALGEHLGGLGAGECLVVSTHGAAGRVAAAWLLGLDVGLAWRVLGGLGNCHWGELREGRRGWWVETWNASAGVASRAGSSPP
ncbi:MAG TPA: histidine phosphatase family protein [Phycicoccus sp.]|nr:histidine phosphatase family protein [Phycicoccus sp.]